MAQARRGFKLIKEFDDDEHIVSMLEFEGQVFVATNKRVYRLHKSRDKLVILRFEVELADDDKL